MGSWSNWGSCSRPCGGGTRRRSRSVTQQPINGGAGCPSLSQSKNCNTGSCWALTLRSYGDKPAAGLVPSGVGAKVKKWSSNILFMSFDFKCEPHHRTYGRNPRTWSKLFRRWYGGLECTYCAPGRRVAGARRCYDCPVGYDNPYHTRSSCSKCRPGHYTPHKRTPKCYSCAPGSYQEFYGASACDLCEPGTYSPGYGYKKCLPCPQGYYQVGGDAERVACGIWLGTYGTDVERASCGGCAVATMG